jgi:hypothetical protein
VPSITGATRAPDPDPRMGIGIILPDSNRFGPELSLVPDGLRTDLDLSDYSESVD